jgi:hypothetical protein
MNSKDKVSSGGVGFFSILALIFITLKLTGYLDDWSWWQVTAPIWVPLSVTVAIAFIGMVAWFCLKFLK